MQGFLIPELWTMNCDWKVNIIKSLQTADQSKFFKLENFLILILQNCKKFPKIPFNSIYFCKILKNSTNLNETLRGQEVFIFLFHPWHPLCPLEVKVYSSFFYKVWRLLCLCWCPGERKLLILKLHENKWWSKNKTWRQKISFVVDSWYIQWNVDRIHGLKVSSVRSQLGSEIADQSRCTIPQLQCW